MDDLVRTVSRSGRTVKVTPLPKQYAHWEDFGEMIGESSEDKELFTKLFDLKVERNPKLRKGPIPGKPVYGECHICGTPMQLYMGLRKGHSWHFFYCPYCDKCYRYE